jgi:hypothetical protein
LTAHLEKTVLSKKMIEEDLIRVEESANKLGIGFEGCEVSSFLASPTTKRKQQSNPPKLTTHPTQSLPSTLRER